MLRRLIVILFVSAVTVASCEDEGYTPARKTRADYKEAVVKGMRPRSEILYDLGRHRGEFHTMQIQTELLLDIRQLLKTIASKR